VFESVYTFKLDHPCQIIDRLSSKLPDKTKRIQLIFPFLGRARCSSVGSFLQLESQSLSLDPLSKMWFCLIREIEWYIGMSIILFVGLQPFKRTGPGFFISSQIRKLLRIELPRYPKGFLAKIIGLVFCPLFKQPFSRCGYVPSVYL
jgi:hypothetical protein